MKTEIFVCTHKQFQYKLPYIYKKLQVGAALKEDLGYLKDSAGENISVRNPNYCEVTGLYWMWKNSDADIAGLVHYRRYFYASRITALCHRPVSKRYIQRILKSYDMILPKKFNARLTAREIYARDHHGEDFDIARAVIAKRHPEYLSAFEEMADAKEFYLFNMFCCKKEVLDLYCEWLFDILFMVEEQTDISSYDAYNKRIYGFLAERLFQVWILKNKCRIKECYVYNVEADSMFGQAVRYPFHCWLKRVLGN